jgi:1-acyl-sn-glycerol-3-phosphate acyltransferase
MTVRRRRLLPPSAVRRLVFVPLVVVIAAALVVLTPPLAVVSAAYAVIRKSRTGRAHRMRTLRLVCFALVWFLAETAALTVFGCLWIASGFGGRLDTEPYQSRHFAVMRWLLALMYRAAQRTCGLRVQVTGPPAADGPPETPEGPPETPEGMPETPEVASGRPLIVLSRHAGPGDSLLLVHHLLTTCDRRPRLVMKATLQLDPSLDVLANRLPNVFVHHRRASQPSSQDPQASPDSRHHAEQIKRLAVGLDRQGALVIFPEGGNWTPQRWRRAIARLRRSGLNTLAERALAMPNVLAPRTAGTLAALAACPSADVIFVAHTGLDRVVSIRDVWQSLAADVTVSARWWRVPAPEVPRAAGHQAQVDWLYDWWQRVDAWISAQHARPGVSATANTPHPAKTA